MNDVLMDEETRAMVGDAHSIAHWFRRELDRDD